MRNCTLFKNGEAAGEDALKKGAFFGSVATLFSFHPLAIGFLAAITAQGNKDLWALDILDYDEKEWLFMVESREEGEDLLKFLDRYYMAAAYLRLWLLAAVRCLNCKRAAIN